MLLFLAADSCYGATRAAFGKNKREQINSIHCKDDLPRRDPKRATQAVSGGGHLVDNSPQALVLSRVLASLFVD